MRYSIAVACPPSRSRDRAALALDGARGIAAMFADTDGSDGGTPVAGGLVDWFDR